MSTDIKLTQAQDISIANGDIELITEGAEVTQSAKIRILHIRGEWVFDYTLGVDWFGIMFSTESSYLQKKAELQRAIAKTPDLRRLLSFDFAVDSIERAAQVDFEADTNFGPISTDLVVG
jgi:hypothetical protein